MKRLGAFILAAAAAAVGVLGIRAITSNNAEEVDTSAVTTDAATAGTDDELTIDPPLERLEIDPHSDATLTACDGLNITVKDGHVTLHMSATGFQNALVNNISGFDGNYGGKDTGVLLASKGSIFTLIIKSDPVSRTTFSSPIEIALMGNNLEGLSFNITGMLDNISPDNSYRPALEKMGITDQVTFDVIKNNTLLHRNDSPLERDRIGEIYTATINLEILGSRARLEVDKEASLESLRLIFQQSPSAGTKVENGEGTPIDTTPQRAVGDGR